MKLSVIIPTFNRRHVIEQTLPTVLDQTLPADDYEVIVVVDGSEDGTAEALRDISSPVRLVVIEQENLGQAVARNRGVKAASGELVLLLDDDIFCGRTLLAEHVAAHIDGDCLVFGPILVAPQSPKTLAARWMSLITDDWLSRLEREGVRWPDDAIVMANSSMRRDVLDAVGGFDDCFFRALEDVELGLRLWDAGVRFHFCKLAVTYQLYLKTTDGLTLHDAPLYGGNEVLLCRKHPKFRQVSQFAAFTRGNWFKRKGRELIVRFTLPVGPLLTLAESLARSSERLAIRFFNARYRLSIYHSAVKASGGWKEFERGYAKVLPILMYHVVGPARPGTYPELTVSPGKFKKQVRWLKLHGYETISTSDWQAWCLEGKPLPEKPVLLTFDDAYADLVEHAFPVLKDNGYKATVFVVTGEIGGSNTWDCKAGSTAIRCMNSDEIRQWSEQGIEFGAHTHTHRDLTTLPASGLESEIARSSGDLADILGVVPKSLAYPFGMYNEAVHRCVKKTFQLAFTCDEGLNGLGTELHMLRRTMVQQGDTMLDFAFRLKLGFSPIERLIVRVRTIVRFRSRLRRLLSVLKGS